MTPDINIAINKLLDILNGIDPQAAADAVTRAQAELDTVTAGPDPVLVVRFDAMARKGTTFPIGRDRVITQLTRQLERAKAFARNATAAEADALAQLATLTNRLENIATAP